MYDYGDFEIETLKRSASQSCKFRGHTMGPWRKHDFYRDTVAYAYCVHCNMQVVINVHPAPNDTVISGEAVALNCCKRSNR
jgi:hypothetical protein